MNLSMVLFFWSRWQNGQPQVGNLWSLLFNNIWSVQCYKTPQIKTLWIGLSEFMVVKWCFSSFSEICVILFITQADGFQMSDGLKLFDFVHMNTAKKIRSLRCYKQINMVLFLCFHIKRLYWSLRLHVPKTALLSAFQLRSEIYW
jgi:hypothetical protein